MDGASDMGVERGERVPVLRLDAIQNGLEDGDRVAGDVSLGSAYRVDGAAACVLQDAADIPEQLVRCVVSAVLFAFSGGSSHAVGMLLVVNVEGLLARACVSEASYVASSTPEVFMSL